MVETGGLENRLRGDSHGGSNPSSSASYPKPAPFTPKRLLCPDDLRLLPHPYSAGDRKAGYRYQISILQAKVSLTQVLDRPVTGRVFFEEASRENLDIGRAQPGAIAL